MLVFNCNMERSLSIAVLPHECCELTLLNFSCADSPTEINLLSWSASPNEAADSSFKDGNGKTTYGLMTNN